MESEVAAYIRLVLNLIQEQQSSSVFVVEHDSNRSWYANSQWPITRAAYGWKCACAKWMLIQHNSKSRRDHSRCWVMHVSETPKEWSMRTRNQTPEEGGGKSRLNPVGHLCRSWLGKRVLTHMNWHMTCAFMQVTSRKPLLSVNKMHGTESVSLCIII